MRYFPKIISLYRRNVCHCKEKCYTGVEFRDVAGDVGFTLCADAAEKLAFSIISGLVHRPDVPPPLHKTKTWTKAEERELMELIGRGLTCGQAAMKLGRNPNTVRKKIAYMKKIGKWRTITQHNE